MPHGYFEHCIRLAQLVRNIRQDLYDGPVREGQRLTQAHFNDATDVLNEWLAAVPPHLHVTMSVPPQYRRSLSLLHLRYWSAVMLVTRPFLLLSLLRRVELGTLKQPTFDKLTRTCISAAESSLDILESMVQHKVVSSLVMLDFFLALQVLQVILAAFELYREASYQVHAKRCAGILLAIATSGYPKHLLPEPLFQLQECGLTERANHSIVPEQRPDLCHRLENGCESVMG